MIIIWDNGGQYDSHIVYFIDIGIRDPSIVEQELKAISFWRTGGKDCRILGVIRDVRWWDRPKSLYLEYNWKWVAQWISTMLHGNQPIKRMVFWSHYKPNRKRRGGYLYRSIDRRGRL